MVQRYRRKDWREAFKAGGGWLDCVIAADLSESAFEKNSIPSGTTVGEVDA